MDEDVPLHLWSELRPVTSLFVQLQFSAEANLLDLRRGLSNANRIISAILSPHKGENNKSLLFDKVSVGEQPHPQRVALVCLVERD